MSWGNGCSNRLRATIPPIMLLPNVTGTSTSVGMDTRKCFMPNSIIRAACVTTDGIIPEFPIKIALLFSRENKQCPTLLTTNLSCLVFVHTTTSFQNSFIGTDVVPLHDKCNEKRFWWALVCELFVNKEKRAPFGTLFFAIYTVTGSFAACASFAASCAARRLAMALPLASISLMRFSWLILVALGS